MELPAEGGGQTEGDRVDIGRSLQAEGLVLGESLDAEIFPGAKGDSCLGNDIDTVAETTPVITDKSLQVKLHQLTKRVPTRRLYILTSL